MTRSLGFQGGSRVYVQALDQERLNNNIGKSSTNCIVWLKDLCYDSNALFSLLLVVHESWLDSGELSDGIDSVFSLIRAYTLCTVKTKILHIHVPQTRYWVRP